jgi:hypothetical protein
MIAAIVLVVGQTGHDPATDVDPIDFQGAWSSAMKSMHDGLGAEEALAQASRVIEGEVPFEVRGPFLYAENWLQENDANLLQHEIIRTPGWDTLESPASGVRLLSLHEELPAWASSLATRLGPALDGCVPDCCEVHALEPGMRSRPIDPSAEAVLSLAGPATFCNSETSGDAALTPRSVLLLPTKTGAAQPHGYRVQSGSSRHLSVVFWSAAKKS